MQLVKVCSQLQLVLLMLWALMLGSVKQPWIHLFVLRPGLLCHPLQLSLQI
jgi:hypothetical protein